MEGLHPSHSGRGGDDYELRQDARDREYEGACEEWLAKATPEEIERAKALGLVHVVKKKGKPDRLVFADTGREEAKDVCHEDDAATLFENSTRTSTTVDIVAAVDKLPEQLVERFGVTKEQGDAIAQWHLSIVQIEVKRETSTMLQRIIGFFLLPGENLRIRAHGLAHAARMAAVSGFTSLHESAKAIECSVEAIRKVAWRWIELLSLPPLPGAKSEEARAAYSKNGQTNHWRKQKCQAAPPLPSTGFAPANHSKPLPNPAPTGS